MVELNMAMKQYEITPSFGKKAACTCFIVPASILEKIIKEGTAEQREKAAYNLKVSQLLRGMRVINNQNRSIGSMAAHETKRRVIYDMDHSEDEGKLPGTPVRYEGDGDTGDFSVDDCYKNTGIVYDFYWEVFGRNSINGAGMSLVSSVNFADKFDNAFWNGQQMTYGDGSGIIFVEDSLTALDVTAHELQHGVTQFATPGDLDYHNESGGLNESWSDCFGIMCKQWSKKQKADDSDWLIGDGIMVEGKGLRSMKDPGTANPFDDQIDNVSDYKDGQDPHKTSGPPNKAFYLACTKVGGFSWDKVGKAWFSALPRLPFHCSFQMAANYTFEAAGSLFGEGDVVQTAIQDAWHEVGVEAKKPDLALLMRGRTLKSHRARRD